jgi:hypothetical protein
MDRRGSSPPAEAEPAPIVKPIPQLTNEARRRAAPVPTELLSSRVAGLKHDRGNAR